MADSERTVERAGSREGSAVDVSVDPTPGERPPAGGSTSRRSRLRARLGDFFSVRQFLLGAVATLGGLLLVGGALPLGTLGALLGIVAGAFAHGALARRRRYAEAGAAGGAVAAAATVLDHLALTVLTLGVPVLAVGLLAGAVAGLVGHYLGRDLRDGLTRDL